MFPYTRSPRLLKGKLCFFSFSQYWNVIPLGSTHPRSEPRPGHRDVIRGLASLARSALFQNCLQERPKKRRRRKSQLKYREHLSLEISSFETQQMPHTHTSALESTGGFENRKRLPFSFIKFHSWVRRRGAWDYGPCAQVPHQIAYIPSHQLNSERAAAVNRFRRFLRSRRTLLRRILGVTLAQMQDDQWF